MGLVTLLSLYRCNSMDEEATNNEKYNQIRYFVTDYFDGIQVETFSEDNHKTLAECMGIQPKANENKEGVSHHRYWLYSEDESQENIFSDIKEYPLLTVIQIFLNPDIYQASNFTDTGEKISEQYAFTRMKEVLHSANLQDVNWAAFRLLTAGSFAIIVRSKTVKSAYDVASVIRKIRVHYSYTNNQSQLKTKNRLAFHTYSIFGVADDNIKASTQSHIHQEIEWNQFLSNNDLVVLRVRFAQEYHIKNNRLRETLDSCGKYLAGRYDYEITLNAQEFHQLYPYIRTYKFNSRKITHLPELKSTSQKTQLVYKLLRGKYLSYINERIQIYCDTDDSSSITEWQVSLEKPYISLYNSNLKRIKYLKREALRQESSARFLYKYSRNLQEFMRIYVRFTRILHEVNYRRELRTSVANLLRQYQAMMTGLKSYLDEVTDEKTKLIRIRKEQRSRNDLKWKSEEEDISLRKLKDYAAIIEEQIGHGMYSLEIFLRYLRNINFQTLQTPNFDLQTNISIEKLLVAYSTFMKRFLSVKHSPYISRKQLHPILVPNIISKDFSVNVLFNEDSEGLSPEKLNRNAVVYSPSFANLCQSCSLIPSIFHEIAHQFRYEPDRKKRNKVLWDFVTKLFISDTVQSIVDEENLYDLRDIKEELIHPIWKVAEQELYSPSDECALSFEESFIEHAETFYSTVTNRKPLLPDACKTYIEKTKSSIRSYSEKNLRDSLMSMTDSIEEFNVFQDFLSKTTVQDYPIDTAKKDSILLKYYENENDKKLVINRLFSENDQELDFSILNTKLKKVKECQENQLLADMLTQIQAVCNTDSTVRNLEILNKFQSISKKISSSTLPDEGYRLTPELVTWWNNYQSDFAKYSAEYNEIVQLLKHFQEVQFFYEQVRRDASYRISYQELLYQTAFDKLCKKTKDTICECLDKLSKTPNRILDWENPLIPAEESEYLKKKFHLMSESAMKKEIRNKIKNISSEDIAATINKEIRMYREITSDLFMCAIMKMDAWGYLSLISEMFKFSTTNLDSQLVRINAVIQCIYADVIEKKNYVGYYEELNNLVLGNLNQLYDGLFGYYNEEFLNKGIDIPDTYRKWFTYNTNNALNTLEDYYKFLALFPEDVEGKIGTFISKPNDKKTAILTSTQRWVIRISKQNLSIILALRNQILLNEEYETKCIWSDITGPNAYYNQKDSIHELLAENQLGTEEIKVLCEDISAILNHPAEFFVHKKALLSNEIQFLLREYEESCSHVFDSGLNEPVTDTTGRI